MHKLANHPTPDDPNKFYTPKQYLQKYFYYKDGQLIKHSTDKPVGTVNTNGYLQVMFERKLYTVHKLIYILLRNRVPALITHADGNKLNNRIENLVPKEQRKKPLKYGKQEPKVPKFARAKPSNIVHPYS